MPYILQNIIQKNGADKGER